MNLLFQIKKIAICSVIILLLFSCSKNKNCDCGLITNKSAIQDQQGQWEFLITVDPDCQKNDYSWSESVDSLTYINNEVGDQFCR